METKRILADLRAERDRINQAIVALEALDSAAPRPVRRGRPTAAAQPPARRKRRRMSAAVRKRLSEAMKARWAERKKKSRAS